MIISTTPRFYPICQFHTKKLLLETSNIQNRKNVSPGMVSFTNKLKALETYPVTPFALLRIPPTFLSQKMFENTRFAIRETGYNMNREGEKRFKDASANDHHK